MEQSPAGRLGAFFARSSSAASAFWTQMPRPHRVNDGRCITYFTGVRVRVHMTPCAGVNEKILSFCFEPELPSQGGEV